MQREVKNGIGVEFSRTSHRHDGFSKVFYRSVDKSLDTGCR
jgi:hypothetical protein